MGYIDSVFGNVCFMHKSTKSYFRLITMTLGVLNQDQFDICNLDAAWFLVIREKDRVTITKNKTMH